jgi:hypothetical protein
MVDVDCLHRPFANENRVYSRGIRLEGITCAVRSVVAVGTTNERVDVRVAEDVQVSAVTGVFHAYSHENTALNMTSGTWKSFGHHQGRPCRPNLGRR